VIEDIDIEFERSLTSMHINNYVARLFVIPEVFPEHSNVAYSFIRRICAVNTEANKHSMCRELFVAHAIVLSETNQKHSCKVAAIAAATELTKNPYFEFCKDQLNVTEIANYLEFVNRNIRKHRERNKLNLLIESDPDLFYIAQIVSDYSLSAQLRAQATKNTLCISHFMNRYFRRNKAFLPEYTSKALKISLEDAKQRDILKHQEIGQLLHLGPESVQNLLCGKAIPLEINAVMRCSTDLLQCRKHSTTLTELSDIGQIQSTRPVSAVSDKELVDLFYHMINEFHDP